MTKFECEQSKQRGQLTEVVSEQSKQEAQIERITLENAALMARLDKQDARSDKQDAKLEAVGESRGPFAFVVESEWSKRESVHYMYCDLQSTGEGPEILLDPDFPDAMKAVVSW